MPTTGAPTSTWYPDDTAPVAPLENLFLQLATSVNVWGASLLANGWARGQAAQYVVTNLAALDALTTAVVGDTAFMTTPGTGINALTWEAYSGSGATIDWRPTETIRASTKANLDSFISSVAAVTDTFFEVGAFALVTGTGLQVRFTSTAGAYIPITPIHAEYTYVSASIATATNGGPGTLTLVTASSSALASTYFTPITDGLDVPVAGVVRAHTRFAMSGAAAGRSLVDVTMSSNLFRNSIGVSEDNGSGFGEMYMAAGNDILLNFFQSSGAGRSFTGRLVVDYLGPLG